MDNTLFGIPLPLLGTLSLLVALFYLYKTPQPPPGARPRARWQQLLIRWGHSAVWVLLAAASFAGAGWLPGDQALAELLARLALLLYLLFIVAVFSERRTAG